MILIPATLPARRPVFGDYQSVRDHVQTKHNSPHIGAAQSDLAHTAQLLPVELTPRRSRQTFLGDAAGPIEFGILLIPSCLLTHVVLDTMRPIINF